MRKHASKLKVIEAVYAPNVLADLVGKVDVWALQLGRLPHELLGDFARARRASGRDPQEDRNHERMTGSVMTMSLRSGKSQEFGTDFRFE